MGFFQNYCWKYPQGSTSAYERRDPMRKGEKRRGDILRVAESLFYSKGYESTTVQDILDELKLSKGGFYHHFESKEQLLESICQAKALQSAQAARSEVESCPGGAVDKLNALFDKNGIWQDEHVDFLGLLIRVAYRDDNLIMREKLKRYSLEYTLPLLTQIISDGLDSGEFASPHPEDIARVVMLLGSNLTDEIALYLLSSGNREPDMARILTLLELYRHAIERLLDAPYGTVVLYQMGRMANVCQMIWRKHTSPDITLANILAEENS